MKKYNLINELEKRDNFMAVVEYAHRKGNVRFSIDSMESYFLQENDDGTYDYLDELPPSKEWTSNGSCSVDVSAHYFPNLLSLKGISTFCKSIANWIKESIEEPFLFKYPPFGIWSNWVFVFDSWEAVKYDMVDKKLTNYSAEEYNKELEI